MVLQLLELLLHSLIISLSYHIIFNLGVELWGGASYTKCITQIDKFVNRAYIPLGNGYVTKKSNLREIYCWRD